MHTAKAKKNCVALSVAANPLQLLLLQGETFPLFDTELSFPHEKHFLHFSRQEKDYKPSEFYSLFVFSLVPIWSSCCCVSRRILLQFINFIIVIVLSAHSTRRRVVGVDILISIIHFPHQQFVINEFPAAPLAAVKLRKWKPHANFGNSKVP